MSEILLTRSLRGNACPAGPRAFDCPEGQIEEQVRDQQQEAVPQSRMLGGGRGPGITRADPRCHIRDSGSTVDMRRKVLLLLLLLVASSTVPHQDEAGQPVSPHNRTPPRKRSRRTCSHRDIMERTEATPRPERAE